MTAEPRRLRTLREGLLTEAASAATAVPVSTAATSASFVMAAEARRDAAEDAAEEAEIREERRVLARLRLLATLLPASDVTAQDGRTHEGVEGGAR